MLDEDDFLDPFGALNKVKARKIRMVIFISNFFSKFTMFRRFGLITTDNNIMVLLGLNTVQMKRKVKGHKDYIFWHN